MPHNITKSDLTFYHKKLKCLDIPTVQLQGDYNSVRAQSLVLNFEKCQNSTSGTICKSPEDIIMWLRRKFVLVNSNRMRFSTRDYDSKSKVVKESFLNWVPINSQLREEVVYKIYLTDLYLQDNHFQFSDFTEDELRIFSLKYDVKRPYEFFDSVHLQVTIEFDLTLHRVDRNVYGVLDWVGDVGGLYEGVYLILYIILVFTQFHDFEHFLIEYLFIKSEDELNSENQSTFLDEKKTSWLRQKLISIFPKSCRCKSFSLSKEEKLFKRARRQLREELDIVKFVKKIRRLEYLS